MFFWIIIPFVAVVMVVAIGQPLLQQSARLLRLRRAQQPAGAVVYGSEVAVSGQAQPAGQPLAGPLTDTPCLFWRLEVQEMKRRGKSSRWVTILSQHSGQPFLLSDGFQSFQVQPGDGDPHLERDYSAKRGFFSGLDDNTRWRLERAGVETKNWLGFNRTLRAYESVIVPGDSVCALGVIDYGTTPPTLRSAPDTPLLLGDGSIDDLRGKLRGKVLLGTLSLLLALGFMGLMLALATGLRW